MTKVRLLNLLWDIDCELKCKNKSVTNVVNYLEKMLMD